MSKPISEDYILQVCNDISENMLNKRVSKNALIACIKYWQDQYEKAIRDRQQLVYDISERIYR